MKKKKTEPRFVATSIQLLTQQFEALSRMKVITGKSISVLIREAVDGYIRKLTDTTEDAPGLVRGGARRM